MEHKYLKFAKKVAKKAGKIMLKYFKKDNEASYKLDQTIVTIADKKINEYLINMVKKYFPSHCVYGEEESFNKSKYAWVCDPIDGTAMYARGIPVAVFSLALVINGEPIIGVVYDPFTKDMYSAIKGNGAYKNKKRISVNSFLLRDKESVANFDMWPSAQYDIYDVVQDLGKQTYFVAIGSVIRACMCVATGEFNLSIFPGTINKNYDLAAAKVIVEEAGGKVTDLFGNEQRYDTDINGAIISNGKIHSNIVDKIKQQF